MKNQNYYYHLKHFQDQDIKRATQRVNHPENNRENIEKLHKMHMAVANKIQKDNIDSYQRNLGKK